jgi:hypothetical protein
MCEILAACFEEERSLEELAPLIVGLELYGIAKFGWGVAWRSDDGAILGARGLGRFEDEALSDERLMAQRSNRFLVHLRRPSQLSTIHLPDTQPFFDGETSAFCHNGYLDRADDLRTGFDGRLEGRADSEVGWQFFLDELARGVAPLVAMAAVDATFGGKVNLGYLAANGELDIYSQNTMNRMWRFLWGGGVLAATDMHSDDGSLFDLVVGDVTERECLAPGTALQIGPPLSS